ncbi:hypothetical protein [Spiroplasma citri]|uniref:hypothetical protein n=1 Tax=Spiroplasma citri TaxID=2133 RepID=UPI00286F0DCB|nr:hypothetical protein [Spiroplasma citri]
MIISNYNIQDDTEIMILGDGANWIKGVKKDIANRFPNNKVHYTIDKFNLVKRFKDLLPHRRIIKENKETFKQVVDYFYNGKYYELLQCLKESKSFIPISKKFLRETINLIKNNEEGIKNQTLWNNIGCHMEGDVSHYGKGIFSKKGIYSEKNVKKIVNTSMIKLRNNIKDFKQSEKPPENNSILYNNFNKNEQQKLRLY